MSDNKSNLDIGSLQVKVNSYNEILSNTINYRKDWHDQLKPMLVSGLGQIIKETGLKAKVEIKDNIQNLEVVVLTLGSDVSGLGEKLEGSNATRPMIKHKGALVYQQLFNGKMLILIMYPSIEGYGEPRPPRTVEILRPHEMKEPFILRHVEEFMQEIIAWEDYDDDKDDTAKVNPIGFNMAMDDVMVDDIQGK